jgi:hypothetical protein
MKTEYEFWLTYRISSAGLPSFFEILLCRLTYPESGGDASQWSMRTIRISSCHEGGQIQPWDAGIDGLWFVTAIARAGHCALPPSNLSRRHHNLGP